MVLKCLHIILFYSVFTLNYSTQPWRACNNRETLITNTGPPSLVSITTSAPLLLPLPTPTYPVTHTDTRERKTKGKATHTYAGKVVPICDSATKTNDLPFRSCQNSHKSATPIWNTGGQTKGRTGPYLYAQLHPGACCWGHRSTPANLQRTSYDQQQSKPALAPNTKVILNEETVMVSHQITENSLQLISSKTF